jgi:hypothetical protein
MARRLHHAIAARSGLCVDARGVHRNMALPGRH